MVNRKDIRIRRAKGKRLCKVFFRYADHPWTARNVGMLGTTPSMCSCRMCGNPRRYAKGEERLTMQERKDRDSISNV